MSTGFIVRGFTLHLVNLQDEEDASTPGAASPQKPTKAARKKAEKIPSTKGNAMRFIDMCPGLPELVVPLTSRNLVEVAIQIAVFCQGDLGIRMPGVTQAGKSTSGAASTAGAPSDICTRRAETGGRVHDSVSQDGAAAACMTSSGGSEPVPTIAGAQTGGKAPRSASRDGAAAARMTSGGGSKSAPAPDRGMLSPPHLPDRDCTSTSGAATPARHSAAPTVAARRATGTPGAQASVSHSNGQGIPQRAVKGAVGQAAVPAPVTHSNARHSGGHRAVIAERTAAASKSAKPFSTEPAGGSRPNDKASSASSEQAEPPWQKFNSSVSVDNASSAVSVFEPSKSSASDDSPARCTSSLAVPTAQTANTAQAPAQNSIGRKSRPKPGRRAGGQSEEGILRSARGALMVAATVVNPIISASPNLLETRSPLPVRPSRSAKPPVPFRPKEDTEPCPLSPLVLRAGTSNSEEPHSDDDELQGMLADLGIPTARPDTPSLTPAPPVPATEAWMCCPITKAWLLRLQMRLSRVFLCAALPVLTLPHRLMQLFSGSVNRCKVAIEHALSDKSPTSRGNTCNGE